MTTEQRTAWALTAQRFADGFDDGTALTESETNARVDHWIDNPNPSPTLGPKPATDDEITFFKSCVWVISDAGWRNEPLRASDIIIRAHQRLIAQPR